MHPAGDALLKQVAQRLVRRARETDFVAGLEGDEFAIVANNLTTANGATVIAQAVKEVLRQSINLDGTEVFTTASVGITLFPKNSGDPDILLKNAAMAIYQAKNVGRGKFSYYNAELKAKALCRKELEHALRTAIFDDGLRLKNQPKIDITVGKIVGVEALLRWTHKKHGEISPAEFIPIVETFGLIVPICDWVLRKACEQLVERKATGLPLISIAVNLSAAEFKRTDLVKGIGEMINEFKSNPACLKLEITESMSMENIETAVIALHGLHNIGLSLAINDLDTGHSSSPYLKRFPSDKITIKRPFMNDVVDDADDATITKLLSIWRSN